MFISLMSTTTKKNRNKNKYFYDTLVYLFENVNAKSKETFYFGFISLDLYSSVGK